MSFYSITVCFIVIVFGVLNLSLGKYVINRRCIPPRGDICVEIWKCPYFAKLLETSPKPRPKNVIAEIRNNQCGFYGNTPEVCCNKTTQSPMDERDPNQEDSDLMTNHKNFQLLPRTTDCGTINHGFRITSGSSAVLGEFPWMALLAYITSDGLDFRCGGTVINDRYVLTAAHCVMNTSIVGVRLGEHNLNTEKDCEQGGCAPPVQDFYVEDTIIHPNFSQINLSNDIALLRLATSANFSYSNVKPICLPFGESAKIDLTGKFVVVSGWGVTELGYKSPELLKVSIPVVSTQACKVVYASLAQITDSQICAGGYLGKDSCGGDSGGPLKMISNINNQPKYVQYGIVSYGPRHCGVGKQPAIYTRITHYLGWILDNIKSSDD